MNFKPSLSGVALALSLSACLAGTSALAGPVTGVGNTALRSDIQILANAGVIDDITTQWPLAWQSILARIDRADLSAQPAYVRDAARRVMAEGDRVSRPDSTSAEIDMAATSDPAVVRGFGTVANSKYQGQFKAEARWQTTTLHLSIGGRTKTDGDRQVLDLDGTYADQKLGPVELYAGWRSHWWGPGWVSAMSLSNNARPMPQIGITRTRTDAFESPWLSWIGPWQMEMFGGLLNGKRQAKKTGFVAFRFDFNPLPGLEIGLARTTELCGSGHKCSPLKDYFDIDNNNSHVNNTNDEANIDIRYSGMLGTLGYEAYAQFMNEDTNPFWHSGTSKLFGGSLYTGVPRGMARFTVEYADSVATRNIWGGGKFRGFAYNNGRYYDGWRYRGRTMGFSLDSDSRLLSFQAQYIRDLGDSYTLSFHHAEINKSNLESDAQFHNPVSTKAVTINTLEATGRYPFRVEGRLIGLRLTARVADDQPRPDHGWTGAIEGQLCLPL